MLRVGLPVQSWIGGVVDLQCIGTIQSHGAACFLTGYFLDNLVGVSISWRSTLAGS